MTREEMLGVAMGVGSSILPSFANRVLFADAVMQFGLWVEHQSAQDLRTQLAEAKAKLEARDDDALSHCLRGNDLQAELDQSQAKITSLELDKARLVESICNFLRLLISTATIGERDKLEQVVPSELRRLLTGDKS